MTQKIRGASGSDREAILDLIGKAFPDEDLVPLTTELLAHPEVLTYVAENGGSLCGMVCWSQCVVGDTLVSLLGPLAVLPEHQRGGVGSALVRAGLVQLKKQGVAQALVLGDPTYYGRFGFVEEDGITPPYPLPAEWKTAWQGQTLAGPEAQGVLEVPAPWQVPELWSD